MRGLRRRRRRGSDRHCWELERFLFTCCRLKIMRGGIFLELVSKMDAKSQLQPLRG
jgi:hypothetical protein